MWEVLRHQEFWHQSFVQVVALNLLLWVVPLV